MVEASTPEAREPVNGRRVSAYTASSSVGEEAPAIPLVASTSAVIKARRRMGWCMRFPLRRPGVLAVTNRCRFPVSSRFLGKEPHRVGERVGGRMGSLPASSGVLGSRAPLRRAIPPLGLEHLVID